MAKIAVLGGEQFIGCYITNYLNSLNVDVVHIRDNKSELSDIDCVINCLDINITEQFGYAQTVELYSDRTKAVLSYWRQLAPERQGSFKYILLSSYGVYGSIESGDFCESSAYNPSSLKAASACSANLMAMVCHKSLGLPVIEMVTSSVYGVGQDSNSNAVNYAIDKIFSNKNILLGGNGKYIRDYIYIKDLCMAVGLVLEGGVAGEKYCVSSGHCYSALDVVATVCCKVDSMVPECSNLIKFSGGIIFDRRRSLNCGKMTKVLGFRPAFSLEDGISDLVSEHSRLYTKTHL